MKAVDFYKAFINNVQENRVYEGNTLREYYRKDKNYTPVITKIICEIIESYGLVAQKEYFNVDVVGYLNHPEDIELKAKEHGLKPYLWDMKIVVEHENAKALWGDELIKLVHLKSPLKVVIAYNHSSKRDDKMKGDLAKLTTVSEWLNRLEAFRKVEDEEYMIIFGNCQGKYDVFDYRGYVYNWKKKGFERIHTEEI